MNLLIAYATTDGQTRKIARFGFGSTCHTSKFVVHTEVILQSHCSVCLRCSFYLYVFFCFNRLV